ncbi:hypothetical protein [Paenarthrobacter aromaticivorans]|uniref:Uncharacterized protein n=1 Tax=Paenarthrobacter aromaticivorans TaxID=2849150 RepID=A0ABS6I9V5_9MICC|nr:hypothetical protein [Paenarthrobacter sp. MMS21-TAE1-1]MBU8867864.1 hypothetical protein [Paenarthrobacter sp. MMS21-TAE1-1]
MNETGNKEEYTLPSTSYVLSMMKRPAQESVTDPNLYFQIPEALWTEGFFQKLKGPGLVMLLILLAEQANTKPVWFSGAEFFDRYRISPSTRTKGTKELVDLGMLITTSVPLPATWGESPFEQKRRRFEYRLIGVVENPSNGESEPVSVFSSGAASAKKTPEAPPSAASDSKKRKKRKRQKRKLL